VTMKTVLMVYAVASCRAWLGCLPDRLSAEHALPNPNKPSDVQLFICLLPAGRGRVACLIACQLSMHCHVSLHAFEIDC
jgi:hypothetical protein